MSYFVKRNFTRNDEYELVSSYTMSHKPHREVESDLGKCPKTVRFSTRYFCALKSFQSCGIDATAYGYHAALIRATCLRSSDKT